MDTAWLRSCKNRLTRVRRFQRRQRKTDGITLLLAVELAALAAAAWWRSRVLRRRREYPDPADEEVTMRWPRWLSRRRHAPEEVTTMSTQEEKPEKEHPHGEPPGQTPEHDPPGQEKPAPDQGLPEEQPVPTPHEGDEESTG